MTEAEPTWPPQNGWPPEKSGVTPEEQARIEESGREFESKKRAAQESRTKDTTGTEKPRQPEGIRAKADYADQSKLLEGQQKRIIRAKIENLTGGKEPLPKDITVHRDMNDDSIVQTANAKKYWEAFKSLFR